MRDTLGWRSIPSLDFAWRADPVIQVGRSLGVLLEEAPVTRGKPVAPRPANFAADTKGRCQPTNKRREMAPRGKVPLPLSCARKVRASPAVHSHHQLPRTPRSVDKVPCALSEDPRPTGLPESGCDCDHRALRRAGYGQTLAGHAGLKLLASVKESWPLIAPWGNPLLWTST